VHGLDRGDGLAVVHVPVERVGDPAQVVVELDAGRIEVLQVHEFVEPAAFEQVVDERVAARRIAHRDEILQKRDLHPAVVEQHAAVPAERGLALDEALRERARAVAAFRDTHRQREVRRPEADADQVEYGFSLHVSQLPCR
jgi:hypothetical protein